MQEQEIWKDVVGYEGLYQVSNLGRVKSIRGRRPSKDNPDLPAANKLIKSWLVRSREHLDSLKDEVVFLCEHYKARAYISCAPKSIAKLNTLILRKLADNLHTGNVINPWHVFNSACGELQGVEKRWGGGC